MVDRKIRLLWNNGGGSATKIVTHNVTIESATIRGNLLTNEHMWYKITAERTGNIGRLNVRKVRPVSICPKSFNSNFTWRYKREYRPPVRCSQKASVLSVLSSDLWRPWLSQVGCWWVYAYFVCPGCSALRRCLCGRSHSSTLLPSGMSHSNFETQSVYDIIWPFYCKTYWRGWFLQAAKRHGHAEL